jgi:hypothetical protein
MVPEKKQLIMYSTNKKSRTTSRFEEPGSSGSIVSDYGLDFSSSLCVQPPVQWVQGVISPGVKARPGCDADHSPPSSAEVVNE